MRAGQPLDLEVQLWFNKNPFLNQEVGHWLDRKLKKLNEKLDRRRTTSRSRGRTLHTELNKELIWRKPTSRSRLNQKINEQIKRKRPTSRSRGWALV